MHAHKRRIRTERSCAIGARPLSHKRALFRQRRDGTGVHDNAHCHKRERKREKPAQQRGYGRAPKGTPRIGPAMKGQFHRSRSFSHKTWSYVRRQDNGTVWCCQYSTRRGSELQRGLCSALQQIHGIDVDGGVDGGGYLARAEQAHQRRRDIVAQGRLHHDVVAVGVAQLRQHAGHCR